MKNVIFTLSVLGVCGFGGLRFYLPKLIDKRIDTRISSTTEDFRKQSNQLTEILKNLESRLLKLETFSSSEHRVASGFKIDFDRWDCWCDLRNKLLCGDEYLNELDKFCMAFSDCPDLLKMVDSIITNENCSTKSNSLINNLLRFAKICSIDKNELDKISGCVILSLIRKVEENE